MEGENARNPLIEAIAYRNCMSSSRQLQAFMNLKLFSRKLSCSSKSWKTTVVKREKHLVLVPINKLRLSLPRDEILALGHKLFAACDGWLSSRDVGSSNQAESRNWGKFYCQIFFLLRTTICRLSLRACPKSEIERIYSEIITLLWLILSSRINFLTLVRCRVRAERFPSLSPNETSPENAERKEA